MNEKKVLQVHPDYIENRDMILMTLPLFVMAFFFYGPRPLLLAIVAVITARLADRLVCMLRAQAYNPTENTSVFFALVIVLLMPASVRYRVVVATVAVAVLVAKYAFGGYRSYPFNPAAVGFCVAAVSWPEEILRYPAPQPWLMNIPEDFSQLLAQWRFEDATLLEGASFTLKMGGLPNIEFWDLLLGRYAGPLGVTANLVIISCAVFLLVRGRISFLAPAAFLATAALVAFFFPRFSEITWPGDFWLRLQVVKFELLSSTMLFAAVFMLCEQATLPKSWLSRLIYGALLGFATMMFRYFGIYEQGLCFAFLLINAVSGYFDRAVSRLAVGKTGRAKGDALP